MSILDDVNASSPLPRKLVVAGLVVDERGLVLITQRRADQALGGLWEFPGGKIEPNETPEDTVIREVREELGLSVKAACLAPLTFASHAYAAFHLLMPLFICRRWEGFAKAREGQTLRWARPGELRDYEMPPADEPLIPHLVGALT